MMNENDVPILSSKIDKSQVPSIQQKRMVAFVNHFIVNTVAFLNKFIANCETKFIAFESRLQNVEASLLIVEAKLESISGICDSNKSNANPSTSTLNVPKEGYSDVSTPNSIAQADVTRSDDNAIDANATKLSITNASDNNDTIPEAPSLSSSKATESSDTLDTPVVGVRACEDVRYRKYFKMNQFGVPLPAVKLKMEAEGYDPNILNEPNRILEEASPE